MNSVKQEPEEISNIIASNLLELYGSEEEEDSEDLTLSELKLLIEVQQKKASVNNLRFSCEYCGAGFKDKSALRVHQIQKTLKHENHHGSFKTNVKYKCKKGDCKITFSCRQQWYDHVELYHPLDQPRNMKCSECSFVAINSNSLKSHSVTHKPKHQCDQCSRSFKTWTLLTIHKLKHKDIDEMNGNQTRRNLRKHKILAHPDQRKIVIKNSNRSVVNSKQITEKSQTVTETLTFVEGRMEEFAGYSIKKEPQDAFPDIEIHSMATSNQQEMSSEINQELETGVKHEQEESPSVTEILSINIHVKEEPEVSHVLNLEKL